MLSIFALIITMEAGYTDNYAKAWEGNFQTYNHLYSDIDFRLVAYDNLFIGYSNYQSFIDAENSIYYIPVTETYTVSAGIVLGDFEFGILHVCSHPVGYFVGGKNAMIDDMSYAYNRLYAKYKVEISQ